MTPQQRLEHDLRNLETVQSFIAQRLARLEKKVKSLLGQVTWLQRKAAGGSSKEKRECGQL